ncbi:probable ubiquitin-conjugating enzyme E2 26 isoform X2 [Phragmites australis]|uniref:probable ubiquitin-conjugating enzyme E2 26 isoform X2 n=1 Tax=Phragmites australis TaxID=29695 RepID=UPI002D77B436|nr:probable ubiquitin-conjugating enzyme E2 26 isoform X2 [Phragmites australis]
MDATEHPHMQGGASSSSSCRAADYSAAWDAVQQQKRQRCQGSSSNDQVGSSTENNSLQASGPELKFDYGENEDEDYYFEDEDDGCYDDDDEGSDYELDYNQLLADKFDDLDLPPGVEATVPWLQKVERDGPDKFKSMSEIEEEIAKKYNFFKQFDTVDDFSDHHYAISSVGKARKEWAKRIQHDWTLLEKDLPPLIYVRVSENRMDLLRAVMIGPQGTPYHDGLFFFDAQFPASYPASPPVVYYHSGGLRLNPNLYCCGKVCLSLLGTWEGRGSCEKWNPAQSTMLQVLISIQALVLNEKPYFNEPGYEHSANTADGQRRASEYNDTTFQHSCRTMLYSLRRPPQHFEDLVAGHFRERGRAILAACKYYMKGHEVGSKVPEEEEDKEESKNSEGSSSSSAVKPQHNKPGLRTGRSPSFKTNLEVLFEELLMEFNVKGADTAKFRAEKLKNQPAAA